MSAPFAKNSLSTKLLLLTLIFVFIAEFVVLVPSIAKQRSDWFGIRFEEAYLASLALEGPREGATDEELVRQLFSTANILGVTINSDDMRMLILAPEINPHGASNILRVDLTQENWMDLIANAWATIFSRGNRLIQATGAPQFAPGQTVDIIVSQQALRRDLHAYARNIFFLSLIISTLTAGLVYWALNRMIVRPVRRLTANIVMFDADPENPGGVLTPSGRKDEIGVAEESLAAMERSVRDLLGERRRLAAVGAGISKISHDLRNILASAQLMSDRLAKSEDPSVRKLSPRLISALDRAIALSRDTLTFGRMEAKRLDKSPVTLRDLVDEVFEDTASMGVTADNQVSPELTIFADRTQLYRALFNLVRNAIEAIVDNAAAMETGADGTVSISTVYNDNSVSILIADTGPGLPDHAKAELFEPFKGSQKPGGSGLGVAIAAEIVRAHGGKIALQKSDETGAVFQINLPHRTSAL